MPVSRMKGFTTWDFYSPIEEKLMLVDGDETPFVTYPNGVPCFEANMYMRRELHKGSSRKVKGSTLSNYAYCIIHLVKYCFENNIRFSQLTDSSFTLFVQGLQGERDNKGELVRSNNQVIYISRQCLDFLKFVQECNDLENFIGEGRENTIKVSIKETKIAIEGSKNMKVVYSLSHTAIPSKDAKKKRLPASEDDMLKAWNYIGTQSNKEVRERDQILYQCMEFLGARVTEIDWITIKDIEDAAATGNEPYIKLNTLKRRDGDDIRSVPIPLGILSNIKRYIRKTRRKVINRTIGKKNDHGYLFVSTTTGRHLDTKTITSRVSEWKRGAGIEGAFHPHLFRHSFVTNKLKEMILKHKEINSADDFRKHLLHTERFKMELKQWTGHTKLYSLDTYINLVFADLAGYSKTYNAVRLNDSVKAVKQSAERIRADIKNKTLTPTEAFLMIDEILEAFELDIKASLETTEVN